MQGGGGAEVQRCGGEKNAEGRRCRGAEGRRMQRGRGENRVRVGAVPG